MGKRSTRKKRGIQRGVAKYKIKCQSLLAKRKDYTYLGVGEHVYLAVARHCFEFWLYCSQRLYLVPFTRNASGQCVPLDRKSNLLHYLAWSVKLLLLLQKLVGLAMILVEKEVKIETFMCSSQVLVHLTTFCISLVLIAKPEETTDLMNSWSFTLSCLQGLRQDELSVLHDLSTAMKIIAVLLTAHGAAFTGALLSLAFSTLPTCYFPMAESFGLIPQGLLSRFTWQLLFFPLELITNIAPTFSAPLSGSLLFLSIGVLKTVGHELR